MVCMSVFCLRPLRQDRTAAQRDADHRQRQQAGRRQLHLRGQEPIWVGEYDGEAADHW